MDLIIILVLVYLERKYSGDIEGSRDIRLTDNNSIKLTDNGRIKLKLKLVVV